MVGKWWWLITLEVLEEDITMITNLNSMTVVRPRLPYRKVAEQEEARIIGSAAILTETTAVNGTIEQVTTGGVLMRTARTVVKDILSALHVRDFTNAQQNATLVMVWVTSRTAVHLLATF